MSDKGWLDYLISMKVLVRTSNARYPHPKYLFNVPSLDHEHFPTTPPRRLFEFGAGRQTRVPFSCGCCKTKIAKGRFCSHRLRGHSAGRILLEWEGVRGRVGMNDTEWVDGLGRMMGQRERSFLESWKPTPHLGSCTRQAKAR